MHFLSLGPGYCPHLRVPLSLPPAVFANFGYYTNMVQQIDFITHVNIQTLQQFFNPRSKVKFKVKDSEKNRDSLKNKCGISNFVCEVTHEYGDDLIRFSASHR